jgi:hypothetical protein
MTKLRVVVLSFPYFIDNRNIDYIYLISLKILNG